MSYKPAELYKKIVVVLSLAVTICGLIFLDPFSRAQVPGINAIPEYQIHAYEFHQTDVSSLSALQENRHNLPGPRP